MRAAYINGYGGNSVVTSGEVADPIVGTNEALVAIRAAGVNPVEIAMRQGLFHAAFPFTFPQVMGYDISGVVESAPVTSAFKAGDAVYARLANLRPGAYAGATAGPGSQEFMAQLGADRTIDYTRERFEDAGRFDVVLDGVCGVLVERGIDALAKGGRYIGLVRGAAAQAYREIGFPPPIAEKAAAGIQPFVERARQRGGEFHGPLTRPDGAQLADIATVVDGAPIRAVVSQLYSLDGLSSAYETLASGHTRGKLVVVP